ncbi:unnamed protein product [Enterobius vermicularis]|uniref:Acetyltransf_18 domain-containing protein n=1 Tax=Enterobius vermicularis TaxID=51028 RepID=A0A0N4VEZ2_ENTVE|nr:unnamed protein product [Enterobius vermicularis]
MLTSLPVHELLEKTKANEVLCGRLLPTNNNVAFIDNNTIYTVTVVDNTDENKPIAFGAFHICSKNQVVEIADPEIQAEYLPQYYGAFGDRINQPALVHAYDQLIEMTFTIYNMDVTKNITVDLYNFELFNEDKKVEMRDRLGFLVSNDCNIYEVTANKSVLQNIMDEETEQNIYLSYEEMTEANKEYILDYDSTISLYNRDIYLEFLLSIKEIVKQPIFSIMRKKINNLLQLNGVVACEAGQPVGYALGLNNRVLQCYAETESIARGLLRELLPKISGEAVTMFVPERKDKASATILDKAIDARRIQRYHSRIIPAQIKWEAIFAMNIGLALY